MPILLSKTAWIGICNRFQIIGDETKMFQGEEHSMFLCSLSPRLWYRSSLRGAQSIHGRLVSSHPVRQNYLSSQAIELLFYQVIVLIYWDVVLLLYSVRSSRLRSKDIALSLGISFSLWINSELGANPTEGSVRVEIDLKMQSSSVKAYGFLMPPPSPNKHRHIIRESGETDRGMKYDWMRFFNI